MGMSESTATYGLLLPKDDGSDAFDTSDFRTIFNAIEDLLDGTTTNKTFSLGGGIARSDDIAVAIGRAFTITAGANGYHLRVGGTIAEASSGTHTVVAGIRIDAFALTNAGGGTTNLAGLYIAGAPTGASPTNGPYAIYVAGGRSRFDSAVRIIDAVDFELGSAGDALVRWSTSDADNHALALGLGNLSQALHITDAAAINTDWNIAAGTHPTVYVHSNTTPATDYLKLGAHDGTTAYIDVVGGTTLRLAIAGTNEIDLTATAFSPATSDGNALGTTSLMWGDLFLASASVVNWNNGDVTLTHAAGKLTFGGDGSVELDFNNHEMTNVDINSGAIDGTTIGAASAAVATVTTLNATTVSATTVTLTDVSLSRGAADRLDLATGDSLQMVDGTIDIGGLTSNTTLGKQLRFSTGSAYDRYASIQAYRGGDAATIDMVFNVWTGGSAIEGMRIFSNGGLVVGSPTGSTKGAGTINATAVYDDDTLLTDYVFAEDYRLIPIPEMREFYEAKGHLPTIPGRDEWEATGQFSLGKMATRLWETVEVHARYIAELEHEIALLRGP